MQARWATEFIPENAESLFERLRSLGSGDSDESEFASWREVFGLDGELFAKRLQSLNITEEQAKEAVSRRRSTKYERTPAWYAVLRSALNYPAGALQESLPFAALWWPAISYAQQQLLSVAEHNPRLTPAVLDPLARHLLKEVCSLAAEPTYQVFAQYRKVGGSFDEFIESTRSTEYMNLFGLFPALARAIAILLSRWIETSQIFLVRLRQDWEEICALAPVEAAARRIRCLQPGLSDRHEGGFQAILLEFENHTRIVYKPKDMSLEAVLPEINGWLAAEGSRIRLRFPRCLNKGPYGWSEFIAGRPCSTIEEVRHYFYQAGALLCLAYVLNARDLLADNLIACGPDPVPIDLETFFQAEMQNAHNYGRTPAKELPEHRQRGSVMDTGLLPVWHVSGIETTCDLSGLCGNKELISGLTRLGWQNVNTDEMRPIQEPITSTAAKNLPIFQDMPVKAEKHLDEILRGFTDLYSFLIARQQSFLRYLDDCGSARTRVIYRSAAVYARLIKESLRPAALTSGVKRSLVFERLFRPPLRNSWLSAHTRKLLESEVESLTYVDIPRIYTSLKQDSLQLENGTLLSHALWEPPLRTVKRRVENLWPQTLEYHLENIEQAISRKPSRIERPTPTEQLTALAVSYAEALKTKAHPDSRDFLWRLPSFCPENEIPSVDRLGTYTGDLGILIFLAAASKAEEQPLPQELLHQFLRRWQRFVLQPGTTLGICHGLGSLIYGAILLHRFTDDRRWIEFATGVATHISEARIRACTESEITFGIAGLLIALVNLYDVTGDKNWVPLAETCIRTLEERFSPREGWIRPNGESALGFAHGSAGIAFAGLRYARSTLDERGIKLAQCAFEFDRRFYSSKNRNWPILTTNSSAFMRTWCAGLPGILLARATAWQLTGDQSLYSEVNEGLPHFDSSLSGTDHWCCGNLGNAEILSFLEDLFNRKKGVARELVEKTIERALGCAFYRYSPSLGDNYCFQPSLFRGLSGVGYTLLRFAKPKVLPFILGFEI